MDVKEFQEALNVKWLSQVIGRSGMQEPLDLGASGVGADDYDGDATGDVRVSKLSQNLHARHIRQIQIEKDEIGSESTGEVKPDGSLHCGKKRDLGSPVKNGLDEAKIRSVIFDRKNREFALEISSRLKP